jgi:Transglycosylase associated protein
MTLPVYNTSMGEDQVHQLGSGPKPCRVGLLGAFLAGLIISLLLPDTTPGPFGAILATFLVAVVLLAIMHFVAGLTGRARAGSQVRRKL